MIPSNGYVYITSDDLPDGANTSGRFYLRELEAAEGYILDEEYRVTIAELAFCAGISSQLLSLIELDSGRQSPQHEAMLRRACAALMSARHAELAQMEAELSACPNIFTMEQGDQDGV